MDSSHIECVAASLVREFLSRKGLKGTLQMMDHEMPRTEMSISNRHMLMKELHIEKLMKKNKELVEPLRTMMEIIAKYFLEMTEPSSPKQTSRPSSTKSHSSSIMKDLNISPASDVPTASSYLPSSRPVSSNFSSAKSHDMNNIDISPASDIQSSYSSSSRPVSSNYSSIKARATDIRNGNQDLVIDDDVQGETVLGEGKSGVMTHEQRTDYIPTQKTQSSRPRSGKIKGFSGPITSNLDEPGRNRKLNKPRPLTTGSRKIIIESEKTAEATRRTSLNEEKLSSDGYKASSSDGYKPSSVFGGVEELLGREKRSIQDVLELNDTKTSKPKAAAPRRQSPKEKDTPQYSVDKSSIANRPPTRGGMEKSSSSNSLSSKASTKVGDVEFGDCDDLEDDLADLDLGPKLPIGRPIQNLIDARPITIQTAINLKTLIFGSANLSFNDEWRYQSLNFCDLPRLKFGIVQKRGGPCGVLAAIQACVLKELLFGDCKVPLKRFSDPTHEERSNALATALAKICWQAGENKTAVVVVASGKPVFQGGGSKFKADDLTETLMLNHFKSYEDLLNFLVQNVRQFETDGTGGVILALYSVIFSRYIDQVRQDMDEPTGKLMGAHGYCTQDMVNLILTGQATSNVFNDVIELDSGNGSDVTILKGVKGRSDIGLLSLFEHYKSCQVGTYLKTPKYPIWVVCSESHFSVLFSIKKELVSDWKAERRFDLYYYDGLARQQEEIKLTIDTADVGFRTPAEEDLVPPLEHCIRTKWSGAQVDWNGTEPLL